MLNTAAHFDEIAKHLAPWQFIRSDVNMTDGDQQVPEQIASEQHARRMASDSQSRNNIARVLNNFVEIATTAIVFEFIGEVQLEVVQFFDHDHI